MTDTNSIFTENVTEPRSLSDITDGIDGARAVQADARTRLSTARHAFGAIVGGGDSTDYLDAVQSEHLPQLRAVEQEIVDDFDRHLAALHQDRRTLTGSAWRPDPAITTDPAWSAALAVAQSQLDSLPPDTLLGTIQGAVLHRDRSRCAALATLASRLTSRTDLSTWERASLQAAIGQCQALSGERSGHRVLTNLDRERVALQGLRGEIVQTANATEPGSVGNILDTYQFGTALGARPAAPLDRESLFRRAGVGPAS